MAAKKKLIWNVYEEDFNRKDIKLVNILDYSFIKRFLLDQKKLYKKALKQFEAFGTYTYEYWKGDVVFNEKTLKKCSFEAKFKQDVFAVQFRNLLMSYFWSRCEYEIVLTSWPPYITSEQVKEIKESTEEVKYRKTINLELAKKIDVFAQIVNNWEPFINYIWDNLFIADLT